MNALAAAPAVAFPGRAVLDHLTDGVLATDCDLEQPGGPRIVYANRAFGEITGYDPDELIGKSPGILQGPDTDPGVMAHLGADLRNGLPFAGQTINYRKDGTAFMMEWSISAVPAPDGSPGWFVALQRDATLPARRLLDAERAARIDALTGLPNRRHCDDVLADGAWLSSRTRAALVIDLDHFKAINDTHGHLVGDEVLREVGTRLQGAGRDADFVARWGGEEFCVLTLNGHDGANLLAERLLDAVGGHPIPTGAGPLAVTASIGYVVQRFDIAEARALLEAADAAMYEAKAAGRNRICVG